jgi:hypothetical protein
MGRPLGSGSREAQMPETPFDNVEAAHEYVGLLLETVGQARTEVAHDLEQARAQGAARQVEALQLVAFKLDRLEAHLGSSRQLLNDLRRLRTLLLADEGAGRSKSDDPDEPWGV